jgi:Undecaprenyl-phosphate glucose phosphotransferase
LALDLPDSPAKAGAAVEPTARTAKSALADRGGHRRGPFRPERLTPVRARLSHAALARFSRGLDLAAALAGAVVAAFITGDMHLLARPLGEVLPLLIAPPISLWALGALGAYKGGRETLVRRLTRVVAAVAVGGLPALGICLLTGAGLEAAWSWIAAAGAALLIAHVAAWAVARRWRAQGRLTPNIVVVGATPNAARLIESALATREANVLGIFDDRLERVPPALHGVPVLGDTKALLNHKVLPYVDRIVITVTSQAQTRVRALIEKLRVLPNAVTLFLDVEGQDNRDATLQRLADAPLTQVSGVAEDEARAFWKRVQDLVIAGTALVLLSPVLALIALAVKLDSPGPAFFRQRRHGFNNEAIWVWKFRSMRVEATDHTAARQVTKDDDRVTRLGRFIRKTSLDELPQLINIVKGEMSLVGPRPHPIGMKTAGEDSARLVWEYAWRHRMKPGLTGWAQINGSRGPVHTAEEVRRRVQLDVEYIERQSFFFDLYIMVMTLPCLLGDREAIR